MRNLVYLFLLAHTVRSKESCPSLWFFLATGTAGFNVARGFFAAQLVAVLVANTMAVA